MRFGADGLVAAVAQQHDSREVLMVAWMDRAALAETLTSRRGTYFSRSRQERWRKGDTSGHVQHVVRVSVDCDGDTVLLEVDQVGPACHTGTRTCFDAAGAPRVAGARMTGAPGASGASGASGAAAQGPLDVPLGSTWPTLEGFREAARSRRVVPVVRRFLGDGETPVGLYRQARGGPDRQLPAGVRGARRLVGALVDRRGPLGRRPDQQRARP